MATDAWTDPSETLHSDEISNERKQVKRATFSLPVGDTLKRIFCIVAETTLETELQ